MASIRDIKKIKHNDEFIFFGPESIVSEIADSMDLKNIGAVPILNEQKILLGVVSERDIVRKCVKDGKTKKEICDMHPNCDQGKLKDMVDQCFKEMKEDHKESTNEAKYVALPSGKEVKKCHDDGMSKKEIMDKYKDCDPKKMQELYASSCGMK